MGNNWVLFYLTSFFGAMLGGFFAYLIGKSK